MIKKLTTEELRRHKGISFVGVTTCFFCHDGRGSFVMTKRSQNARDEHGTWEVPGGGLKWGLTLEENVMREVQEELGAKAKEITLLGYRDVFRTLGEEKTHWLAVDFVVLVDRKEVKINEPDSTEDLGWFNFKALPSPLHSQQSFMFSEYKDIMKNILNPTTKKEK